MLISVFVLVALYRNMEEQLTADLLISVFVLVALYRNMEEQLRADLLMNYTARTRPVKNANHAVDVKAGFGISQILYLVKQ